MAQQTYNNVPMTKEAADRVARVDAAWTGPRLIVLAFATLGIVFGLLWASAEGIIGPSFDNATWGHEYHLLQGDSKAIRPID